MAKENKDDTPDYWHDPQLEEIGKSLVQKHHNHLLAAEIGYLVTKKAMNRGGKLILGKARRPSGLLGYFSRADFLIVVQGGEWAKADRDKREALVDHELCHCTLEYNEEGERIWTLRGHDLEEFSAIVERHGLWKEDVKQFTETAARQLKLPLEIAKDEPRKLVLTRKAEPSAAKA